MARPAPGRGVAVPDLSFEQECRKEGVPGGWLGGTGPKGPCYVMLGLDT